MGRYMGLVGAGNKVGIEPGKVVGGMGRIAGKVGAPNSGSRPAGTGTGTGTGIGYWVVTPVAGSCVFTGLVTALVAHRLPTQLLDKHSQSAMQMFPSSKLAPHCGVGMPGWAGLGRTVVVGRLTGAGERLW